MIDRFTQVLHFRQIYPSSSKAMARMAKEMDMYTKCAVFFFGLNTVKFPYTPSVKL